MEYYREVESSMVRAMGYSPENKVLYIFFKGGNAYKYFDVGMNMYANLSHIADLVEKDVDNVSFGKFFHDNVKNAPYNFKRIKQHNKDEKTKKLNARDTSPEELTATDAALIEHFQKMKDKTEEG